LRISFCGGGSDLPSFYEKHSGCVISTSIDKYIYISLSESFDRNVSLIKYSIVEKVSSASDIVHPIVRESLLSFGVEGIEMSSIADVPAGTGLGSSGSFSVGLINALGAHTGKRFTKEELARTASDIEIVRLKEPVGKQDQYAAAYGGLNYYEFRKDGSVAVEPLNLGADKTEEMNGNLMLFFTGITRNASEILDRQQENISGGSAERNQLEMCELTKELRKKLRSGDIDSLGDILGKGWELKKTLAGGVTTPAIDNAYERAVKSGALGGKLLGAGGGGFLLFYVPKERQDDVKRALGELRHMPFRFDFSGAAVAYDDNIIANKE
jgi:D-glycero-alpha-D-manno-heptose-7-phosphate kinase